MFRVVIALLTLILLLGISPNATLAKKSMTAEDELIPEKDGDYAEPGRPGMRVRVFVHNPKSHRLPSPSLVCSDPESEALVGRTGWKIPSGEWKYNLNLFNVPSSVGTSNFPAIATNGFNTWTSALATSSSKPILVRGSDTTISRTRYDKLNVIAFGRISGSALGVTYIRYYVSSGLVTDVDTIINRKYLWGWNGGNSTSCPSANSYDVQDILTHEQGHWYGLDDEYETAYVDNTMYGYGAINEVKKNTLTTGDSNGIKLIYP